MIPSWQTTLWGMFSPSCWNNLRVEKVLGPTFVLICIRLPTIWWWTAHETTSIMRLLEIAVGQYEKGRFTPTQTQIEERVMMEALITAMNTELTDDQRHVIILRFLEDFSLKETAEIIGKEVNNIKVIQNRGIAKLRKALGLQLEESW